MEAFQLKTGRWIVNECTTVDMEDKDEKKHSFISVSRKYSDVSFLKAMHVMDILEESNITNQNAIITGKSVSDMGYDHYKNFAKREGIIFGGRGAIAEVQNGKIMTEGSFDYNELLEIADIQRDQKPEIRSSLPSVNEEAALPNVGLLAMFNDKSDKSSVDDLSSKAFGKVDYIEKYDKVISILEDCNRNLNFIGKYSEPLSSVTRFNVILGIENKIYKYKTLFDQLDNASKLSKKLNDDMGQKIREFIAEYKLISYVKHSQLLYALSKSETEKNKKCTQIIKSNIRQIKRMLNKNNYYTGISMKDIEQKIFSDNNVAIPNSVDKFFLRL